MTELAAGDIIEVDVHKFRKLLTGEALHGQQVTVVYAHGGDVRVELPDGEQRFVDKRIVHLVKPARPSWAEVEGTIVRSPSETIWVRHMDGWRSTMWPTDPARTFDELVRYTCTNLRAPDSGPDWSRLTVVYDPTA